MAEQAETTKKEVQVIPSLTGFKFAKGTILPIETSLAFNGTARSNGEARKVTVNVDLSGVSLENLANKAGETLRVEFQRTRRDKKSGGAFKSEEAFNEYLTDVLGIDLEDEEAQGDIKLHFNVVSNAPAQKMSTDEAKAELDRILSQLSEEDRAVVLADN